MVEKFTWLLIELNARQANPPTRAAIAICGLFTNVFLRTVCEDRRKLRLRAEVITAGLMLLLATAKPGGGTTAAHKAPRCGLAVVMLNAYTHPARTGWGGGKRGGAAYATQHVGPL